MSMVSTEERLKEIVELTRLYDVYGPLLSDHKKEIFENYILNNYSLGEIASMVDMSRQGVRDIVQRCSKELYVYEDKLGFLKKMDDISEMFGKMRNSLINVKNTITNSQMESVEKTLLTNELDVSIERMDTAMTLL